MGLTHPLPGIAFRAEIPATATLPRMDVAAFVGLARRGPVDTPVAVEDYPHFEDIFGGLYPLAWDAAAGVMQTACLAPAVKMFFDQGGRRCWIVRVAGPTAVAGRFPLAGVLQTDADRGCVPAIARARSVGAWADDLTVRPGLLLDPVTAAGGIAQPGAGFRLERVAMPGSALAAGDLLQVDFDDERTRAYVALAAGDIVVAGRQQRVIATAERTWWFRRLAHSAGPELLAGIAQGADGRATAPATLDRQQFTLKTTLAAAPGDWLRLEARGGARLWLRVASTETDGLRIAAGWQEGVDAAAPRAFRRAQRVRLALQARDGEARYRSLDDLACAAPHPRYAGYLPDDDTLWAPHWGEPDPPAHPAAALWEAATYPRFPLALPLPDGAALIPLGLDEGAVWRGPLPQQEPAHARDGIVPDGGGGGAADYVALGGAEWARFIAMLHVDDRLARFGPAALIGEANELLYARGAGAGVRLRGIHALLPLAEPSLLALPDAAQRGWRATAASPALPPEREPDPPPDPCAADGPFRPGCGPAARAVVAAAQRGSAAAPPPAWEMLPPAEYDATGLLAAQGVAATLAAGRGDMVAMLGLPKHTRGAAGLEHRRDLAALLRPHGDATASYVALYHPWIVTREETGALAHTEPTGAACGVAARRTLERGAWIAPANEVVRTALAVAPPLRTADNEALYGAGINVIWQRERGFTLWGSHTQSEQRDLEDLNVRRLLILLRRLALREGQTYVFAPHSPAFRGRVFQQFDDALGRMFALGAFAGRDPAQAYRVVVDETVNRPATIEQGQFIVELRVAPSQPLTFITVRLIQSDSGPARVQEQVGNAR